MDQSRIPNQELAGKGVDCNQETSVNFSHQGSRSNKFSKKYELVVRIFELIETLTESTKIDVLRKLAAENITKIFRELVIDLSDKALEHLHEELEIRCLGMRAHPRKDCILTADYYYEDRPYCDFLKDISEGGPLFIHR